MFTDTLVVEANMMACGKINPRVDIDRRKGQEEIHPSTSASSSSDVKFELMLKTMEKLMDRIMVEIRLVNRELNEHQIRNPNFRRSAPPPLQPNRPRDVRNPRNPKEKPIRPPFPKNYVAAKDEVDSAKDHIHHFGNLDSKIYLTEEEHDMFTQVDGKTLTEELEQYHKGYMRAIDDVRKIKLRNRDVAI